MSQYAEKEWNLTIGPDTVRLFILKAKAISADLKAECYVPKVVDSLIAAGKADVRVIDTNGQWFGVTYP